MNTLRHLWVLTVFCTAIAGRSDTIERSFDVSPGGQLLVQVDRGSIHITTANSARVEVRVVRELRRGSQAQAREVFERHHVSLDQNGATVAIHATSTKRFHWLRRDPLNNLHVEYEIALPSRFNVVLRTAGGNIDLDPLEGSVEAHTAGGTINLRGAQGDARLETAGGDVHVGSVEGNLTARTSGGSISIDSARGPVEVHTSGGNIDIHDARGRVTAKTSGGNVSAQWTQQPKGNSILETSGGNVRVALSPDVGVAIAARTSGGRVHSEFGGDANRDHTRLIAQVNGGGPDLVLETSGGNINIRRR